VKALIPVWGLGYFFVAPLRLGAKLRFLQFHQVVKKYTPMGNENQQDHPFTRYGPIFQIELHLLLQV
jgi:hypothetical protein